MEPTPSPYSEALLVGYSPKDLRALCRCFGWKMPVPSRPPFFLNSLFVNPGSLAVVEEINAIWPGTPQLFFNRMHQVQEGAVAYLSAHPSPLPQLPRPNVTFPRKSVYRTDYPTRFLRIDIQKGNFNAARFCGVLDPTAFPTYAAFLLHFIPPPSSPEASLPADDDSALATPPEEPQRVARLLARAKLLRQKIFGVVFKADLNKVVQYLVLYATEQLLAQPWWQEEGWGDRFELDSNLSDEVVLVPRPSVGRPPPSLQDFVLLARKIRSHFAELEVPLHDGVTFPMAPVRVEVGELSLVRTTLVGHPGLFQGYAGFREELAFTTDETQQHHIRLKCVPTDLHASFYRRVHSLPSPCPNLDLHFEHNSLLCQITEPIVFV